MSTTAEQHTCDPQVAVDVEAAVAAAPAKSALSEIETLQQALVEKQNQLIAFEAACLRESERQVELEDSVIAWQDKYDRLYESHKRVQKVNQGLEDKMLKLVDRNTSERAQLTSDVATLSVRLAQANFNIAKLQREIERYKNDISLAIQLLQCKPDSFMPQKVSSLPIDIQSKVSAYMRLETNSHSDSECSNSGVGVATTASYKVLPASDSPPPAPCPFPPTAMVYSMRGLDAKSNQTTNSNQSNNKLNNNSNNNNNNNSAKDTLNNNNNNNNSNSNSNSNNNTKFNSTTSLNSNCTNSNNNNNNNNNNSNNTHTSNDPDMISPIIMAKFLEDELKAGEVKHCDTCQCTKQDLTVLADVSRSYTVATQTPYQLVGGTASSMAANLNEPLTQLCLRCNSNLNSPSRTNSPYLMKLVKSSDSVISETKSSVSDLNDMDKLFTPAKKDDLMVNPILGHHRLCDRTLGSAGGAGGIGAGAYAAEKYLLETSTLSQLRQLGQQRRFNEGGGTALELLGKYETNMGRQEYGAVGVSDDLEDEAAKPLLSGISQSNLLVAEQPKLDVVEVSTELSGSTEPGLHKPLSIAPLMKSANSGSVNSLWSKTSSNCEGAKMFENFNRNLIKTIKAENPRHRGPRLCAMRIQQNGQSNILLDNIESIETFTPIIYKRRERLLDEELDDTKDVITSGTSNANCEEVAVKATCANDQTWQTQHCVLETCKEACELAYQTTDLEAATVTETAEEAKTVNEALITTNALKETVVVTAVALPEQQMLQQQQQPQQQQQHDAKVMLPSPKHSNNSKSCTQSSSISDAIDFQENVLLRRQQLSRVAEWVQNNTQQLENAAAHNDGHCGGVVESNSGTERQSSYSTLDRIDSISIEKLSLDSGYKTTPQQATNGYAEPSKSTTEDSLSPKTDLTTSSNTSPVVDHESAAGTSKQRTQSVAYPTMSTELSQLQAQPQEQQTCTTYYRRTTRSGLPVAYTTTTTPSTNNSIGAGHEMTVSVSAAMAMAAPSPTASNATIMTTTRLTPTFVCPEQPTCDILNYKYYPNDTDKTRAIKAELHTTTQNVDIAQMEYNVKQFLLKQNEWSMRGGGSVGSHAVRNGNGNAAPGRPIRQTKLYGPGIGERVRMTSGRDAATASVSDLAGGNIGAGAGGGGGVGGGLLPHRTETNL